MSANLMLPTEDHDEAPVPTAAAPFRMPESPSYHRDDYDTRGADFDDAEALSTSAAAADKVFTSTPPHVEEPALVQPPPPPLPKRSATGQKQPKSATTAVVAKKPAAVEPAAASKPLIAAQRKNQMHAAKRTAALEAEAEAAQPDPVVAQSTGRAASSKNQKDSGAPPPKQSKPAAATTKKAKSAVEVESAPAAKKTKTSKTKDAVPKTKDAVSKGKKAKKTRISFTPQSRHPGKRAPDDTRPRRAVALIDDEAEDDDEDDDDDDFDGDSGADDDEEEEEAEENVVAEEGGAVEMNKDDEDDEEEEDDNATVAISNQQNEESDARLMSSTRPKPRGGPDRAAARRIAAIEFDSESDAEAVTAAAAAAPKNKRKKAADDEPVATVEKNSAKSKRRSGVEHAPVGGDPYDIDAVLQKNAKKFKLVPRSASEPLTTVSVRKEVSRKARDGHTTKLVYRLLHLDRTRRCAYSRVELMQLNKEGAPRIDMDNFLHFAAVEDGKYKMEDVMSFLVDKNGMMCACPRRTLLPLLFLDQNLDYAHFRDFYNKLPEYIDMNNDDKIPPVPPALYTSGEIRKSKPSCPSSSKMNQWTQPLHSGKSGGGGGDDDDDFQSVVPATEFDGDDVRSVATSKHPKAASSRPPRATQPQLPPPPASAASFGVYTNVDLASSVYRGLNLVSRSYGPGTQLPLATFVGNPMARLLLEFGPMCPTEQHAVYFAHTIRSQLATNGAIVDAMIREVDPPPQAAAAAAAPAEDE